MVRRPFVGVFFCLITGIIIEDFMPTYGVLVMLLLLMLAFLCTYKIEKNRTDIVLIIVLLIIFGFGIRSVHKMSFEIPKDRLNKIVTLKGELYGIDHFSNQYYVLKVRKTVVDGLEKAVNETYKVNISKAVYQGYNGKSVSITLKQEQQKKKSNPGDFNYLGYLNSQGYMGTLYINSNRIITHKYLVKNMRYYIEEIRKKIYIILTETLPLKDANMIFGILLGDTSFMGKDVKETFLNTGIAHILAMSGLHFGILYLWIVRFKKILKIHGDQWRYYAILLLWIMALLNGLKPSALRAVLMLSMMLIAPIYNRRYDVFNIMSMIGVVSLLYRSDLLYQPGFQLSYMAVLSIVLIAPWLINRNPIKGSELLDSIMIVVAVQIGMWPVLAYHFNYHSIVGYVLNLPAVYLTGVLVPLSILHLAFNYLLSPLHMVTVPLIRLLVFLLVECSQFLMGFQIQGFYMKSPQMGWMVLYIVFVFMIVWYDQLKRYFIEHRQRWKYLIVVIPMSIFLILNISTSSLDIIFFDVGQGDATLIKHNQVRILIDTGEEKEKVYQKLLKNDTGRLDYLILSHSHSDHAGGSVELMQKLDVKNVVLGTFFKKDPMIEKIISTAEKENVNIIWMSQKDVLRLPRDLTLSCLYPQFNILESEENMNDYSMVIELKYKKFNCLFTGDIEEDGEVNLVNQIGQKDIDILKVPHHGSDTSSSIGLVDSLTPEIAIIQVGTNRYGHPSRDIIELYEQLGIDLFRTDLNGAVQVRTDGTRMNVSSYLNE